MLSKTSIARLSTCHPQLQKLFHEVSKRHACTVLEGFRGKAAQETAKKSGKSKAGWGQSKHNFTPSLAVDAMPNPLNWSNIEAVKEFAAIVKEVAAELGIPIRWGGDFKNFFDGPHYELVGEYADSKLPE